jgi:hypothetical protein
LAIFRKPANVALSFGVRSGGIGKAALSNGCSSIRVAVAGICGSSGPNAVFAVAAVNSARSRSIPHLNLSQPLGSCASAAELAQSAASITIARIMFSPPRS